METLVFLVRHSQTESNAAGFCQEWTVIVLGGQGRTHVEILALHFVKEPVLWR
jgi:broad specificity phosphatase PhoE